MITLRSFRDLDWILIALTLAICSLGVVQIFSAAHDTIWKDAWWKQIVYIFVGLILLWLSAVLDYHTLISQVYKMYFAGVALLVAVLFIGSRVFGSTRWIRLPGGFTFQTSEFMKIVMILLVARFMTELGNEKLDVKRLIQLGFLMVIPFGLVLKQPDLGTALTYLPILLVGIFLAGLPWKYWAIMFVAAGLVIPASWLVMKDYQKDRIRSFVNPESDPKGAGYQVIQSKIAVGHGGMWGRGITRGTQTQLRFLPVPHTDFIFSAFSEEHGFVGVVCVLCLYFFLLMQIVQNAQLAPDRAGMYICMGVCTLLLFHVLVNVGMVVGRMPVTGIPLPLMSSGGSSLLSIFLMLGLVNNVRLRRLVS